LRRAEEHQAKIGRLREQGPEGEARADELERLDAERTALLRAEGIKIKNNPNLLKKSLKREAKQKQKSTDAWKDRSAKVKKQLKERQEKRTKNIAEKKGKKKKKGRPGFEGSSPGFIN